MIVQKLTTQKSKELTTTSTFQNKPKEAEIDSTTKAKPVQTLKAAKKENN